MNRDDAVLQLRNRIGEEEEDFWDTDDELIPFLNKGVTQFSGEERWPWLLTEVVDTLPGGDSDYQLPEGLLFPEGFGLLLTPSGMLAPYQPTRVPAAKGQELRQTFYQTALRPKFFYLVTVQDDGDPDVQDYIQVVRFVPTPTDDMDITFLYYRTPFAPQTGSDEYDVPDQFIDGPLAYAEYLCWRKEMQGGAKARDALEEYAYNLSLAKRRVRKDSNDAETGWGNAEPQLGMYGKWDPIMFRLPELLGP